jgi:hypothetical protein
MNGISFIEGLGIALIASIGGGALMSGFEPWFGGSFLFRLIGTGIASGYVAYLLIRSPRRAGRIAVVTIWVFLAAVAWWFVHSDLLFMALHLCMIWLVRSIYFYNSPSAALIDLILCGVGLASAVWAFRHTGSVALGIWCLFLLQALTAAIPADFKRSTQTAAGRNTDFQRFERAYRSAERALRKLS